MVPSSLGSSSGCVIHQAANPAKMRITGTQSHRVQPGPPTSNPLGESEVVGWAFFMATGYVLPARCACPVHQVLVPWETVDVDCPQRGRGGVRCCGSPGWV